VDPDLTVSLTPEHAPYHHRFSVAIYQSLAADSGCLAKPVNLALAKAARAPPQRQSSQSSMLLQHPQLRSSSSSALPS